VAFRRPPRDSPKLTDISSVANESTAANGIMAKKLMVKTAIGSQCVFPAMMPIGTAMRRMLRGPNRYISLSFHNLLSRVRLEEGYVLLNNVAFVICHTCAGCLTHGFGLSRPGVYLELKKNSHVGL
jgi:hypothetical protein